MIFVRLVLLKHLCYNMKAIPYKRDTTEARIWYHEGMKKQISLSGLPLKKRAIADSALISALSKIKIRKRSETRRYIQRRREAPGTSVIRRTSVLTGTPGWYTP